MDKQRDFVLRTIDERGVKFIRLWFTDVTGTLKSVAIAPAEVEGAFAEGLGIPWAFGAAAGVALAGAVWTMSWAGSTRRQRRTIRSVCRWLPRSPWMPRGGS